MGCHPLHHEGAGTLGGDKGTVGGDGDTGGGMGTPEGGWGHRQAAVGVTLWEMVASVPMDTGCP